MEQYEINLRKKWMKKGDFKKMFGKVFSECIERIFGSENYVIKTILDKKYKVFFRVRGSSSGTRALENLSPIEIKCPKQYHRRKEDDNIYGFTLIFEKNYEQDWYTGMNIRYTTRYGYQDSDSWIDTWSKQIKKRIMKYIYKLQVSGFTDYQYMLFFNRLMTIFNISLEYRVSLEDGKIGVNTHEVENIVPFLKKEEYRNILINRILNN